MIELIKAQSNINYKPDPQRVGKHQASPPFVTSSQLLIWITLLVCDKSANKFLFKQFHPIYPYMCCTQSYQTRSRLLVGRVNLG
jgi:hypothetical protein